MKCKYCGKNAGFLSYVHKECKETHDLEGFDSWFMMNLLPLLTD